MVGDWGQSVRGEVSDPGKIQKTRSVDGLNEG